MQENEYLKIEKTARITWIKNPEAKKLLIVLHGYGQLSTFFAKKFDGLEKLGFEIAIPEGLHRYYKVGSSGRVGASWMTKEEREIDIEDNNEYLRRFLEMHSAKYDKIILLGFSQGGATAARYFCENKSHFQGLILWANVIPPDIPPLDARFDNENAFFVLGNEDEFFPMVKQKEVLTLHKDLGFNVVSFVGKHDIHKETLHSILVNI